MGISKKELFTDKENELAALAKAIGHPARISILYYLIRIKSCINGDLVEELGLAQATISQHLKELKAIGLIQGVVEGPSVCYCINTEKWQDLGQTLKSFFDQYQPDNCC